jgi:Na+/melibiose symporter-like transporter
MMIVITILLILCFICVDHHHYSNNKSNNTNNENTEITLTFYKCKQNSVCLLKFITLIGPFVFVK